MIFSSNFLKRWSFQKGPRRHMIFLVLLGKMIYLFPKNIIFHLRRKMKDDLPPKKYTEIWYSLQTFWKDDLSKKGHADAWSFLYYLERCLFSPKTWYFFPWQKVRGGFLRKYMEIWHFLCTRTGVTNVAPRLSVKKNQRWSDPAKIYLKVIDVLDWHPRKSSSISLYFHGDLYRRFHALLSSKKKKQET